MIATRLWACMAALVFINYFAWFHMHSATHVRKLWNSSANGMSTEQAGGPDPDTIVFSLLMLGATTAREGSQMMKSILMHATRPVDFHIVCTPDAVPVLESPLSLIHNPAHGIRVRLYVVDEQYAFERVRRSGVGNPNMYQLVKLFLHEIIPAEKAIYVDTDALFSYDPAALWREFERFTPTTIAAITAKEEAGHAGSICSCVILLNLAMMRSRSAPLMPSTLLPSTASTALVAEPFRLAAADGVVDLAFGGQAVDRTNRVPWDPMNVVFADQGVYALLYTYRRDQFVRLRQDWDISYCDNIYSVDPGKLSDMATETEALEISLETNGYAENRWKDGSLVPGIIHFNCIDHGDNAWDEGSGVFETTWGSYATHVVKYKWIWLNRGDGSAGVDVQIIDDVRFLDEVWAAEL